jgi:hypothetical protein
MKNKVIIVAPAIKVHFWKDLYIKLSKNKSPFHIVFVGHVAPNFKLPNNFTYIFCDLNAATCAEIAYRYAYKHIIDAEFIVNISDDLNVADTFLDELVSFYKQQAKIQETDLLMVGPICLMQTGEENLMATHFGGPSLLAPALTTIENSKKIGGIDKNFLGVYWDCDRHLRVHEAGGKIIFGSIEEIAPVSEIEQNAGLYMKYKGNDRVFLDKIWSFEEGDNNIICADLTKEDPEYRKKYGRNRNEIIVKKLKVKRSISLVEHSKNEIGKYYE